jgi:hypothetical protein
MHTRRGYSCCHSRRQRMCNGRNSGIVDQDMGPPRGRHPEGLLSVGVLRIACCLGVVDKRPVRKGWHLESWMLGLYIEGILSRKTIANSKCCDNCRGATCSCNDNFFFWDDLIPKPEQILSCCKTTSQLPTHGY